MKQLFFAITGLVFVWYSGVSIAASVANADAEARIVVITERGLRSEHTIAANSNIVLCEKGCFILFPSGDMLPLTGPEKITIQDGTGRIVN